jgi:hypothetical protein
VACASKLFARAHDWTICGQADVQKERFVRLYVDGVRVALTRPEGPFTALVGTDGQTRYVMISDWNETFRLPQSIILGSNSTPEP